MRKTWILGIILLAAAPAEAWTIGPRPPSPANFRVVVTQPTTVDAAGPIEVPVTIQIRSVSSWPLYLAYPVNVTLVVTFNDVAGFFDAANDGGFTCDTFDGVRSTCTGTMVEGQTVTFQDLFVPYEAFEGDCPPGDASTEATVSVDVPEATLADNDATASTAFIHCR